MSEWFETLDGLCDRAWRHLAQGARDENAAARLVVLATVGPDGGPRARTLALRRADREAGAVDLHTDARTPKLAELRADPRAALHLWLPDDLLQIRARGPVEVVTGPDTDADWSDVPGFSRGNYGVEPVPGTPIARSGAYERRPAREKFAVLRLRAEHIDLVHLGEPHHRRAEYRRDEDWAGRWLAP